MLNRLVENSLFRPTVTIVLFARVLASYALYGLFVIRFTKDRKKRRQRMARVNAKNALRVYNAFVLLKGVYIKVGQFLSTQVFLPPEFLREMVRMQDRVPRASAEAVRERIRQEFGKPAEALFTTFDEDPLATASIGQVHRVTMLDGRDAVIKVKYPGIDAKFHADLKLLKRMVPIFITIIERIYHGETTNIDHKATIGEFVKYIGLELDYRNEVENHKKMYAIMKDRDDVIVPELYLDYCTDAIICMEYIDSYGMREFFESDEIPYEEKNRMYRITADTLLYQVSRYGFFQADTHPGNFLVKKDEDGYKLVMIDFGCAKQLPNEFRTGLLKSVQGYFNRDPEFSARAFWDMGFRTKQHTLESLTKWAEFVFEVVDQVIKLFESGDSIVRYIQKNMFELGEKAMELNTDDRIDYIPEEYIMFGRALSTPPIPFDQFQPTVDLKAIVLPHLMYLGQPQATIDIEAA
ncbi:MAG: AarF/ABC1/UbiB kinase family protein [Candidatus Dadabacteria bacterium]|nr:MAG: AarF/ABC1/UbiB kinase family protein [Candidatus Dadabacteria bacterium]